MLVAPGVHRLSFSVDTKPMSMYLLEGDQLILIDSGLQDTPESIYLPAISELGRTADEVGLIFITHADADHIGGNAAARHLFPNARFVCHVNDQRWASDPAVIMAERYDGFRQYGLHYGQAVFNMLGGWMGPAEPMDILVRGGERFRRQEDDWLSVFHVPGHTPGHICLHNPKYGYALIGDAIFGRSQVDIHGNWSAPPPYTTVDGYRNTIALIEALELELLLTCHYPVMRGDEIRTFIDASYQFIDLATSVVQGLLRSATRPLTLEQAISRVASRLGPFEFARDLQFSLVAHLDQEVAQGRAQRLVENDLVSWSAVE